MGLQRARKGEAYGAAVADALVHEHAPLVRRLAHQIASRMPASIEVDDVIQEGMLGLLDAARRWQPQPDGAPFVVYARLRIRGAIYDWLRSNDLLPRHQRGKLRAAQDAITALAHELGREPEDGEVAQALGLSLTQYHTLLEGAVSITVVEQVAESDEPMAEKDSDPFEQASVRETLQQLEPLLARLGVKEQQVLALHYTEHLSYREIAQVLDLTPGRISQLHTQAMLRLRAWLEASGAP